MKKLMNTWPNWPDSRDWIGIGIFIMAVMVLWMIKEDAALREDEFFKVIATLIVGTGFVNGVVGWAYGSTKTGGELVESNARIAEKGAPINGEPQDVNVINADEDAIPVKEKKK